MGLPVREGREPVDVGGARPIAAAIVASAPILRDGLAIVLDEHHAIEVKACVASFAELSADELVELDVVIAVVDGSGVLDAPGFAPLRDAAAVRVIGVHDNLSLREVDLVRSGGFDVLVDISAGQGPIIDAVIGVRARTLLRWEAPRIGIARLTERERAVLTRIAAGASSREIAVDLSISPHTVENYKQRVFRKLGVANQAQAVATALRHGLLAPVVDRGR